MMNPLTNYMVVKQLEGYREAMLWQRIFVYAENYLGLPRVRCTVDLLCSVPSS